MADSDSNGKSASSPRLVVIDTDPGTDDVQAITMMLRGDARGEVKVLGLTTVCGNVSLKNGTKNARRLLATLGRLDVPIYAGAHCSLVGGMKVSPELYHGHNGLGDAHFEEPLTKVRQKEEHAVSALVRLARQHKGKLTILALGPLTNVAMAIRTDAEFVNNIEDIYLMGGNYQGMGNITPSGEFNFFFDPEAAHITLNSVRRPVTVASWELCLNHGIDMEWRREVLGACDSAAARLFAASEAANLKKDFFAKKWVTCDQVAAALLLRPQLATKKGTHHATVEIQGEFTRGQMVVDRRGWHAPMPRTNIVLVEELDMELYKKMLLDTFGHPGIQF